MIPLRRIRFSFDATTVPRHWYGDEPVLTAFWNAFSILLPEGERFFVDSVRPHRSGLNDPKLEADVAGFIAQEAMHSRGHMDLNAAVTAQGFKCIPRIESELKTLLELVRKYAPKTGPLAATCALEHFTALMGEQLLTEAEHQAQIDPQVRELWLWHALEESEHKSVAFDVYRATGGSYLMRVFVMVVATVILALVLGRAHLLLVIEDGQLWNFRSWARTANWLWGKPGLFRKLALPYLAYYKPSFHPEDHDSRDLLAQWTERLFGEKGTMSDRTRIMPVARQATAEVA